MRMLSSYCLFLACVLAVSARALRAETGAGNWVQGVGYVEPAGEVRRLAFKLPGIIADCPLEVGQTVGKGEVLMKQRNAEEQAAADAAQSAVAVAKAELARVLAGVNPHEIRAKEYAERSAAAEQEYASRQMQRIGRLAEAKHVSLAERDMAETDLLRKTALQHRYQSEAAYLKHYVRKEDRALAEARVEQAETALAEAMRRFDETVLLAPIDGTILEILHREGESTHRMGSAEPVLLLGDLSHLRVRAEIDESAALALKAGQPAVIFGRGLGNRELPAKVVLVKPVMGKKTVFAKTAAERKDVDVIQVLLAPEQAFTAPVGLEVDVKIRVGIR